MVMCSFGHRDEIAADTAAGETVDAMSTLLDGYNRLEFFERKWAREYLHVEGEHGRFAAWMNWDLLNDVLQFHRLTYPRLRLIQEGRVVNPARYQEQAPVESDGHVLCASSVLRELRAGASLVIEEAEDTCRKCRAAVQSLEAIFGVRVRANLYAGWGRTNCFPRHWDPHDTFIAQVAGRKGWSVWSPTRSNPLYYDVAKAEEPVGEPVWCGTLDEGCVLYLPRGWWHVASPLDEPSLHLTFTISTAVGLDWLSWLSKQLRSAEIVRQDIPFGAVPDRTDYVREMKQVLDHAMSAESLAAFVRDTRTSVRTRPQFRLPSLADTEIE